MSCALIWFRCVYLQKQPPKIFLKNLAKFTGKHLCWSLIFPLFFLFIVGNMVGKDPSINFHGSFALKYLTTSPKRQSNLENAATLHYKK